MADGFSVDRAALNETAQGINNTIGALKGVGSTRPPRWDAGFPGSRCRACRPATRAGASVRELLRSLVLGRADAGPGRRTSSPCGWASRPGVYADTENYLVGVAKNVTVALAGDPHMTDAAGGSAASWSQDAAQVTGAQTPEGSTTWSQAGSEAAQQWKAVGRTAADGPDGVVRTAAGLTGTTAQLNQEENQLFGPPPSGSGSGGAG